MSSDWAGAVVFLALIGWGALATVLRHLRYMREMELEEREGSDD